MWKKKLKEEKVLNVAGTASLRYNEPMKNWSTDVSELQKDKEKFSAWRIEQLVNFGLGEEKIDLDELRKYWDVVQIDPFKRKFLSLFI